MTVHRRCRGSCRHAAAQLSACTIRRQSLARDGFPTSMPGESQARQAAQHSPVVAWLQQSGQARPASHCSSDTMASVPLLPHRWCIPLHCRLSCSAAGAGQCASVRHGGVGKLDAMTCSGCHCVTTRGFKANCGHDQSETIHTVSSHLGQLRLARHVVHLQLAY